MKNILFILLVATLVIIGCKKEDTTPSTNSGSGTPDTTTTPPPPSDPILGTYSGSNTSPTCINSGGFINSTGDIIITAIGVNYLVEDLCANITTQPLLATLSNSTLTLPFDALTYLDGNGNVWDFISGTIDISGNVLIVSYNIRTYYNDGTIMCDYQCNGTYVM